MISGSCIKYGKHKVPRYIYHITNRANYESMLHDGAINMSRDCLMGKGVFSAKLPNLFKRWGKSKKWDNISLQEKLLQQASEGSDELVILKIPTAKLNHDLLQIRSQNFLAESVTPSRFGEALDDVALQMEQFPQNKRLNWVDETFKMIKSSL